MDDRLADIISKPWVVEHDGYRTLSDAKLFPPEAKLLKELPFRWVVIDHTWRFNAGVRDYGVFSFETRGEAQAFLRQTRSATTLPEFVKALYRNRRYR